MNLADDDTAEKWLVNKLTKIYESKIQDKIPELQFKDMHLISYNIVKRYKQLEEIIIFYFKMFDSSVNPIYQDSSFHENAFATTKQQDDKFIDIFYQMTDQISESAAPFLKYRGDKDMATYIKYLRGKYNVKNSNKNN